MSRLVLPCPNRTLGGPVRFGLRFGSPGSLALRVRPSRRASGFPPASSGRSAKCGWTNWAENLRREGERSFWMLEGLGLGWASPQASFA